MIDGETRRKKCNIKHLEPLKDKIDIKKGASHADIVKEFKKLKIDIKEKKSKSKTEKPRRVRKKKEKAAEAKPTKGKKEKKPSKEDTLESKATTKK